MNPNSDLWLLRLPACAVMLCMYCCTFAAQQKSHIMIVSPHAGDQLHGTIVVTAEIAGGSADTYAALLVDGQCREVAHGTPVNLTLNTALLPNGVHTIKAAVLGENGYRAISPGIRVRVDNAPGAGATAAGDATIALPVLPKIATPPTSLVVVDLGDDRIDGQIAACVLQGIVNRGNGEKIYVKNTHRGWWVQMGQVWLDEGLFNDLPITQLNLPEEGDNPGFMALFTRYRAFVKGVIIYDPQLEDATIEAATTIAGQTDGVVVSPDIATQLAAFKLPVLVDLRQQAFKNNLDCLSWLKAHYFAGANKQVAFTWSIMGTGRRSWGAANKDYVVANRLFTFSLDISDETERAHYADILKEYPPGTPVMGWANEGFADPLFGGLGYYMLAYIGVENLSVMSAFPSVTGTQPPAKAVPVQADTVYLSFIIADGDNLEHALLHMPHTILTTQHLGNYPTTWVVNPALIDLAPRAFTWYVRKLPPGQEMIGMMGDGSPQSDRYSGFSRYCAFTKSSLARAGFTGMKQMSTGELVADRVQPDFCNSGYAGNDLRGLGPYEYHLVGNTFHIGSIVTSIGKEYTNADNIRKVVRESPPGQPLFLSVFCGTARFDTPAFIGRLVDQLNENPEGRKYVFLRARDLAATYKAWVGNMK